MFKILHFSLHKNIPLGVVNQLYSERKAGQQLSDKVLWDTAVFSHDDLNAEFQYHVPLLLNGSGFFAKVLNYIKLRRVAYKWLKKNAKKYHAIVLRYRSGDLFLLKESYWFNNIFTLHHTKEIEEAKTRYGQWGKLEEFIERYIGRAILKKSSGILGVTQEIVDYEIGRIGIAKPSYCYPNGICMEDVSLSSDKRRGCPKFIFITSAYTKWHGMDLVLKRFADYSHDYVLHIVGIGSMDNYVDDPRIKFHGVQQRPYIMSLLSECDVGLGSFGLNRIGLTEACHLKVREYLAAGLPVYSAYQDSGIPENFPYYNIGNIDIYELMEYALYARKISREDVRLSSRPYIEKAILMNKLVEWLKNASEDS